MKAQTAFNWALGSFCAILIAAACNLDGPDAITHEIDKARDMEAAAMAQAEQKRFERAAAEICGNGGWALQADNSVRCVTRKPLYLARAK